MGIFSSDEFGYSDWQEEYQKVVKYKKALKEIKNIAYDGYNNGQTSYDTFQCEKIINKINEVENV